jgi:hypothetical protein
MYEKVEGGGGKGVHLGFRETQVFFIVEWLGRGSAGVIFFFKFIMGRGFRVHWGKGCTLILFFGC